MRPYPLECGALVDDVAGELQAVTEKARASFGELSAEQLCWQPAEDRWGVGHCLVHLARLNELYRLRAGPALEEARRAGRASTRPLRGSWLGRRFTVAMGPGGGRRVQTPPLFRPRRELVEGEPLSAFFAEQARWADLCEEARGLDLDRVRVSSPAFPLLRFRASDVLRFLVQHELRHVDQAERVMDNPDFPRLPTS